MGIINFIKSPMTIASCISICTRPLTAWDGVSLSIFGKKLKKGRQYEKAISCLSDDAGRLCLG
jgi:hypothetical protein